MCFVKTTAEKCKFGMSHCYRNRHLKILLTILLHVSAFEYYKRKPWSFN